MDPSILIVAAERGLGLGLAEKFFSRGWSVTGTARQGADTRDLEAVGASDPSRLSLAAIDVTDASRIEQFLASLGNRRFNVIYFNAGIYGALHQSVTEATDGEFAEIMLTNTFGPIRLAHRLLDRLAETGTYAFMSSHRGSITINLEGGLGALPGQQGGAEHAGAGAVGDEPRPRACGPDRPLDPSRLGAHRHGHARRHGRAGNGAGAQRWGRCRRRATSGLRREPLP